VLVIRMLLGMRHGVMLGSMVMMIFGMQLMAVSQLGMVCFGVVIFFVVRLVGLAVVVSGGFQMMGSFFMMIMLRHLGAPRSRGFAGTSVWPGSIISPTEIVSRETSIKKDRAKWLQRRVT